MSDNVVSQSPASTDEQRRLARVNRQARLALLATVIAIGVFGLALIAFVSTAAQQMNAMPPISFEEYDLPPEPTIVVLPTPTLPPPTPDPGRLAAESTARHAMSDTKPLRGPISGRLLQNTRHKVPIFETDLDLTEFVLEATFVNPDNEAIGAWDYGFIFLSDPKSDNNQYRFIINAEGKWSLEWVEQRPAAKTPTFTKIQSSWVPEALFNFGTGEANHLRLIVAAGQLYVYINGAFIAQEPIEHVQYGGLQVATGLWNGDSIDGHYTRFENFTVWTLP